MTDEQRRLLTRVKIIATLAIMRADTAAKATIATMKQAEATIAAMDEATRSHNRGNCGMHSGIGGADRPLVDPNP